MMIGLAKMGKWRENARVRLAWGLSLFSREIFFSFGNLSTNFQSLRIEILSIKL